MLKKVFILNGNLEQRHYVIQKIKDSLDKKDIYICDNECSFDYVQQVILDNPCFDEKKIIIINDLPFLSDDKKSSDRNKVLNKFKKILKVSSDDCIVVFNGLAISSKSFLDDIADISKVFNFPIKEEKSYCKKYIQDYLKENDKNMDVSLMSVFLDFISPNDKYVNIDKLNTFIKKLNNYIGDRKNILKEDIDAIFSDSNDYIIWNLIKNLDDHNIENSLALVDQMLSGVDAIEPEIVKTIMMLINRYRMILFSSDGFLKKRDKDTIWKSLSSLNKWEKKGSGQKRSVSPKKNKNGGDEKMYSSGYFNGIFYNNNQKNAPLFSYSRTHLCEILYFLQNILIKIRSGCSDAEVRNVFELTCLVICGYVNIRSLKEVQKNNYII